MVRFLTLQNVDDTTTVDADHQKAGVERSYIFSHRCHALYRVQPARSSSFAGRQKTY
jgi:hypothetical protein